MAPAASSRTVLVADDNRFFRTFLTYALDDGGYRCLGAASGSEALAILRRELPDIHAVVLDLALPGLNGFELLARLRALPGGATLPAVVLAQHGISPTERELLVQDAAL